MSLSAHLSHHLLIFCSIKYAGSKLKQSVVLRAQIPFSFPLHSECTQNNRLSLSTSSVNSSWPTWRQRVALLWRRGFGLTNVAEGVGGLTCIVRVIYCSVFGFKVKQRLYCKVALAASNKSRYLCLTKHPEH